MGRSLGSSTFALLAGGYSHIMESISYNLICARENSRTVTGL
jgi:hypothetical protein